MNTINYWKNTDFEKNIETILKKINHLERTILVDIKNNKINNLIKINFHWKDNESLENLIKFIELILNQKKIYDCFFVFFLGENIHCNTNFNFPFFTQQKYFNSNNILYPDYFFLKDYSKSIIRNVSNFNILLLNNKKKFNSKINEIIFRSNNRKYKFLINYFDKNDSFYNIKHDNVKPNEKNYLSKHEQNEYKYSLSLYERYDTIYFNLLTNSIPFIIYNEDNNDKRIKSTFYTYFVKEDIHFIKIKPSQLKNLSKNINNYNFTNILNNKKELINILKYNNVVKFYEKIFYEYSLLFK